MDSQPFVFSSKDNPKRQLSSTPSKRSVLAEQKSAKAKFTRQQSVKAAQYMELKKRQFSNKKKLLREHSYHTVRQNVALSKKERDREKRVALRRLRETIFKFEDRMTRVRSDICLVPCLLCYYTLLSEVVLYSADSVILLLRVVLNSIII